MESPVQAPRRARPLLIRLLALLVATLGALLAGEATVRLLAIDHVRPYVGAVPHPLWHHWHRSNHDFDYVVAAEGYRVPVHFNSLGMRDSRDITIEKLAGVRRIAVLGDSFVEAMQVAEEEGICKQLERELRERGHANAEILNFGCSGFSSTLELMLAREWVRAFAPDLVICLHHFSDVSEDWSYRARARFDGAQLVAVEPTTSEGARRLRQGLECSQLFRVAHGSFDRWRRHRPPPANASLKTTFDAVVHDPYSADDLEAWDYSLRALASMATMFRDEGVPFLLVVIPIGTQVEAVSGGDARRIGFRFLAEGQRLEHQGYQQKVTGFCREHGIDTLDLLEAFRNANQRGETRFYLPRDQHWSAAGHALAARVVAGHLPGAAK